MLGAFPISIGIPAVTMTMNSPTLPPVLAAACAAATLLGLAVAPLPGKWAAERPLDLMWLVADGVGSADYTLTQGDGRARIRFTFGPLAQR